LNDLEVEDQDHSKVNFKFLMGNSLLIPVSERASRFDDDLEVGA